MDLSCPRPQETDRSPIDEKHSSFEELNQVLTFPIVGSSNPFFIQDLQYTRQEEAQIIRTLDVRLFPCILMTTFLFNMDRTNLSNAISDGLPEDLGFNINTVNIGIAMYSVLFSVSCLSGAVMANLVGPSRWIPLSMFAWGFVTLAHALVNDRADYLAVRAWIAITEGGVVPATLVYLGAFYKGTELATRLAWYWGVQTIASAVSGLMASGILQLRGVGGLEGWKWLFLFDGAITVVIAIATWFYLPRNVMSTQGGIRGFKPWFNERQVQIAVTRVIRDDPSKQQYEKALLWSDFKDAVTDLGLWGHMIITAIVLTPYTPLTTYLPTVIKSFNFNVFVANALTAPPFVLQCITTVVVIRHSDTTGERGLHAAFGAGWLLVGWIILRALPAGTSRGVNYLAATIVASWPLIHPLNIAWMSENTGSAGKRTIASGAIVGFANISALWGSQIYRADDAPRFKRGNAINIAFSAGAFLLFFAQKYYYQYRNARNTSQYATLNKGRREEEEGKGNRSLAFHFTN